MSSVNEALMACPFCGKKPELLTGCPGSWFVKCRHCGATGDDRHHDAAIAMWNTRSLTPRTEDAVTPDGDHYIDDCMYSPTAWALWERVGDNGRCTCKPVSVNRIADILEGK